MLSLYKVLREARRNAEKEELAGEFSVVVEDIRVEGLQRIEPGTVFSLIDIELDSGCIHANRYGL